MTLERIKELSEKVANIDLSEKVANIDLSEKDVKDLLQILKMQAMEKQNQELRIERDKNIFHGK